MNIVILTGNVGRDPEVRHTGDGKAVANFSLATRGRSKDADSDWHKCVAFGKTAELIEQYVKKGQRLDIQGSLQTRKWQDKSGEDKYTTEVIVNSMEFAGKGDAPKSGATAKPPVNEEAFDDDIPF